MSKGKIAVDVFEDELLFDVTVAPAVSLAVSKPSPSRRAPLVRGIGEVSVNLLHGDCLEMMRTLPDNSVDSVVTDPPYGLANCSSALITETMIKWASGDREFVPEGVGFMGKSWDSFVPPPAVWDEVFRVLKPGGHVLAFAGSRTQDLMGLAIRLAGFELRDSVAWLYGSGFPKSMDVSRQIDKLHGAEREVVGASSNGSGNGGVLLNEVAGGGGVTYKKEFDITTPATDDAKQWEGWGTALKPAHEPVIMARKPLSEKTVAENVLLHGTGALNIDASRIGTEERPVMKRTETVVSASSMSGASTGATSTGETTTLGRFPANILLDEFTAGLLDEQSGISKSPAVGSVARIKANTERVYGLGTDSKERVSSNGHGDSGGASRFFYVSKAGKSERPVVDGVAHPTVKPIDVMRWLIKLVTPPGGVVLEPFAGSGTTVEAAILEKFDVIAIEREDDYIPLIEARVARQLNGGILN